MPESTLLTTPFGEEVFFPRYASPVPAIPGPSGRLVRDYAGCLRLVIPVGDRYDPRLSGTSPTVLWPRGYSAHFGKDGAIFFEDKYLPEEKRIVAREGGKVRLGSGYTQSGEELAENSPVTEGTKRELFRRCPGLYRIASSVEKVR